jgi:hypothetical protein
MIDVVVYDTNPCDSGPDAPVGFAVEGPVIACSNQGPSLVLLLLFGFNEFLNVTMPVAQRVDLETTTFVMS